MNGYQYLVLGNKGSGKSAIAEKIKSESFPKTNVMTSIVHLSDFPFASFSKIMAGDEEPEAKFPTTWSWLLLVMLLDSFYKDQASPNKYDTQFVNAINGLIRLGILSPTDLSAIVLKSSKHSFKLALPKFMETTFEDKNVPPQMDMQFRRLVEHLKGLVNQFRSPNKHILIIDGLDDILMNKEVQYKSLSALVYETDRLNITFMNNGVGAKIIILCRTDLFERLPGPNKNKIRQDSSYEIDWYHDPHHPHDSPLVHLVNLRARIHFHRDVDIFSMFFPSKINEIDLISFLLEKTRHTPRDFIQLLNYLQPWYKSGIFTPEQLTNGINQYSIRYFLPEIRDELSGYVPREHFDCFLAVIRARHSRINSYYQLFKMAQTFGNIEQKDFDEMLHVLYECSAIGHRWRAPGSGEWRLDFKYRNPNSTINSQFDIILHNGLNHALNLS